MCQIEVNVCAQRLKMKPEWIIICVCIFQFRWLPHLLCALWFYVGRHVPRSVQRIASVSIPNVNVSMVPFMMLLTIGACVLLENFLRIYCEKIFWMNWTFFSKVRKWIERINWRMSRWWTRSISKLYLCQWKIIRCGKKSLCYNKPKHLPETSYRLAILYCFQALRIIRIWSDRKIYWWLFVQKTNWKLKREKQIIELSVFINSVKQISVPFP